MQSSKQPDLWVALHLLKPGTLQWMGCCQKHVCTVVSSAPSKTLHVAVNKRHSAKVNRVEKISQVQALLL